MTTLDKIKDYVMTNPGTVTKSELAKIVGVSRQRVSQLLELNNLQDYVMVKAAEEKKCKICDASIKSGQYCSDKCRRLSADEKYYITLRCAICGESFTIRICEYNGRLRKRKSNLFFCSKLCQGKYVGRNFGFGSKSDN